MKPRRPCVLIVDDEVRGLELAQRILRRSADVTVAESGAAALDEIAEQVFDVIVSDQRMPGISGVELLSTVAERHPCTGRILLTGYADMEATVDAINRASVHAYLHKPCPPEHFRLTVDSVLARMETVRENERLAQQHRTLADARPTLGAVAASVKEIVARVDPTDDETHRLLKRAAEAVEGLDGLLEALPGAGAGADESG